MKVLATGGAGFIGSNFIRFVAGKHPDWHITNYDLLTYAGNLSNLADLADNKNYHFVKGDISDGAAVARLFESGFDSVVNFAAETHVDRSLYDPRLFVKTNILGTQTLLEQSLKSGVSKFLQISTDEVYGSIDAPQAADESWPFRPNSPYAASKASADLICRAYYKTFNLPVMITNSGNNYGPFQFPEKLIPFFITKAINDEQLPVYGDGLNVRDWLFVEDHCDGILKVLEDGLPGEQYNIGGGKEMTNLAVTKTILKILDKPENLIKFVKDRPAHDRRYALNYDKISRELGWQPRTKFEDGIEKTIRWYIENQQWWKDIMSGEYKEFYNKHYT